MEIWLDKENGNYDYLMYADIDSKHPEVIENLDQWAEWFIETTGVEGFRLDAVKHIDSFFMKKFHPQYHQKYGEDFYVFGEFWNGDTETNDEYLESIDYLYDLIDVASTNEAAHENEDIKGFNACHGRRTAKHPNY